jgi:hypothetical protein
MVFFALVVIGSAALVFFLDEISSALKQIFSKPKEHMLMPLVILSAVTIAYEDILTGVLDWLHAALHMAAVYSGLFALLFLWTIVSLPVYLLYRCIQYTRWGNAEVIAAGVNFIAWVWLMSLWVL